MAPPNSLAGRAMVFYLDGKEVAYASGLQGGENHQQIRVDAIGDPFTKEIVTNAITVQFTAAYTRIRNGSAKDLGFMPKGGGRYDALNFPALVAEVIDESTGESIERILGCKCEQRSWNFDQGGLWTENASFQAIRMMVEGEE